jgi:hypothetical protein
MAWVQKFAPNLATEDYPGWCLRFTQTAWDAPVMYYCARESWDNSGHQHTDGLPSVAVPVYWSWWGTINGETRDWGHVAVLLPDGRVLSSPLTWSQGYGQTIASSVDEVSNILGATYLGWTEDMNGLRVVDWSDDPQPSLLLPTQRQAGEGGANRRAAPTTDSELLEPNLEPNEVGNFVNFIHGQDPYGNGNDVWFQGVSGNWFYSGAFTDAGTHDLNDVTGGFESSSETHADTVESNVKPIVKPENVEYKEKPVSKPTTKEEQQAYLNRQGALVAGIKPADLGSIITNPHARRIIWAIYGITGLFIIGIMGGLTAAQWIAPEWFIFSTGVYTAISPAFASLAIANIKPE